MHWDENTPISVENLNNMENRIAQALQNIENGKGAIAAAIQAMGQQASGSDTFAQLSSKIRDISKDADAAAGDVLSGKTYYQGGQKRTGAMPNRAGHVTGQNVSRSGTTIRIRPQPGYYPGTSNNSVQISDPGFVADNIVEGAEIFGLQGTAKRAVDFNNLTGGRANLSYFFGPDSSNSSIMMANGEHWRFVYSSPNIIKQVYNPDGTLIRTETIFTTVNSTRIDAYNDCLIIYTPGKLIKVSLTGTLLKEVNIPISYDAIASNKDLTLIYTVSNIQNGIMRLYRLDTMALIFESNDTGTYQAGYPSFFTNRVCYSSFYSLTGVYQKSCIFIINDSMTSATMVTSSAYMGWGVLIRQITNLLHTGLYMP